MAAAERDAVEPPPGRLVRLGVVVRAGAGATHLARLCDLAGIDVVWVPDGATADAVRPVVERALVLPGPGPDTPARRTVRVSPGRTSAEGVARAGLDPSFAGPGPDLLVGALDDVQEAVAGLAHQGVRDLCCVLPDAPDLADVVAQLTAVAVGSLATHGPHAARSPDPSPPPWAPGPH